MENEYLEEKKEKKGKLFGYIFIFWFICSFVAFFLIEDPYYIVMNFGQYFLVFGSVVFFSQENKKDALITIPFMIIGLCCIVIPFLMLHPELLSISVDWNTIIAVLMLLAFLIAGLCTAIIPVIKRKHLVACLKDHEYIFSSKSGKSISLYVFNRNYSWPDI